MNISMHIKEFFIITIGMLFVSCAVYFFMIPSGIIVGSISGLAIVLSAVSSLSIAFITFLFNGILLIIGFLFLGKEFGAKTVYTSLLLPAYLWLFEAILPLSHSLTGNNVYDLVTYILLIAFGQALLFNVNASSGGLDIVAKIIHKYTRMDIGKAVMFAGFITAASSIFVYDIGILIVSLLGTYANGLAVDYFIDGFHRKKRICIISEDHQMIQSYIMNELKRGVTIYQAIGGYNQHQHIELVTILNINEYKQFIAWMHASQVQAFITVYTVNEVIGTWNTKTKKKSIPFKPKTPIQ